MQRAYSEKKAKIEALTNEEEKERKSKLLKEGKTWATQPMTLWAMIRRGRSTKDTEKMCSEPLRKWPASIRKIQKIQGKDCYMKRWEEIAIIQTHHPSLHRRYLQWNSHQGQVSEDASLSHLPRHWSKESEGSEALPSMRKQRIHLKRWSELLWTEVPSWDHLPHLQRNG